MHNAQNAKAVIAVAPDLLDNESATSVVIDTKGFDYATFYSVVGVTDIALSALKLQESDKDDSGFADVTGGGFSTLPDADDDSKIYGIFVSLLGRKRYLKLIVTAGDGSSGVNFAALALLTRNKADISDATGRGLAGQIILN